MNAPTHLRSGEYGPSYRITPSTLQVLDYEDRERMLDALADDAVERETERVRLAAEQAQRERGLHLRRLARRVIWERRVKAFCLSVAIFSILYFGGRELLAVVQ